MRQTDRLALAEVLQSQVFWVFFKHMDKSHWFNHKFEISSHNSDLQKPLKLDNKFK